MYITLPEARKHLNIEDGYTDDDEYIMNLALASEMKVAKELCVKLEELRTIDGGEEIPLPLKQAILLNLGMFYANREEVTYTLSKPLEQGAKYIIALYRDYRK